MMWNFSLFNKPKKDELRPTERPGMAPADWILEMIAAIGLILMAGYAIYWYGKLPEIIPSHFSGGKVDGYSNKGFIFFLPAVGLFVYGLLTFVALIPHTFNFPVKITPQNALYQYRLATRLLRVLKTMIMFLFFVIMVNIVHSALYAEVGKQFFLLIPFFFLIFASVITYMILAGSKSDKQRRS